MAHQTITANLASPVKGMVGAVTQDGTQHLGRTDNEQAEVKQWINKIAQGDVVKGDLQDLDAKLVSRTFLVGNYFTAADAALYGALHPIISKLQPKQCYSHPSVTRYFDHIQSQPEIRKVAENQASDFPLVHFDLDNAPKIERKGGHAEGKEKTAKKPPSNNDSERKPAPATQTKDVVQAGKEKKKEKKEKKPSPAGTDAGAKATGKVAVDDSGPPVPSMIELRVGQIVDVAKHPDADGLYVEKIDLGEEAGPRTIVSGLVHYIPIEEMRDKKLIVVCNLKPASMRGIKSFGMVLAATSKEGKDGGVELIEPPLESKPGERVYFEGAEFENGTPLSQLNPKKKIFEAIQPGFTTLETREAAWVNPETKSIHRIRTTHGVCLAPTFVGASLS